MINKSSNHSLVNKQTLHGDIEWSTMPKNIKKHIVNFSYRHLCCTAVGNPESDFE